MNNNITPQTNEVITKKNSKINKIVLFALLAIILLVGLTIAYINTKNIKLINSYADKVYPGTLVFDKDISGLTRNELHTVLEDMVNNISSKKINVSINNKTFEESYENLGITMDYDTFETEVLSYGKDRGFFEKLNMIKEPGSKTYEFNITYSDEKISEFLDSINGQVVLNPTNAGININSGSINITPSQIGYELNKDDLATKIKTALGDMKGDEIALLNAELNEVKPAITEDALKAVDTMISSYTTSFPAGPSGQNVIKGAGIIGSRLLMPGESFSTVEAIGPTTPENGFVSANTYLNGKVVPGYGGGVCQISSTIYNAELKAGIIPTSRSYHEMTVKYVPQGLDATIGDEWPDLIFENPYDYPVVVNVHSDGGSITAEFWSNSQATGGITYEPKAFQTGPLSADTYLYGYNSAGERISEVYLDSSTYKPFS